MFILRRTDRQYGETNTSLGDYYSLILKEKNEDQFNEATKLWDNPSLKECYGVITFGEDSEKIMPLYQNSDYYLMASDGRTFDNVSFKKN